MYSKRKFIYLFSGCLVAVLIVVVACYAMKKSRNIKLKEMEKRECRMMLITSSLLNIIDDDFGGRIEYTNNPFFARAAYSNALNINESTLKVEVFYKVIDTCNASSMVALFKHTDEYAVYKVYFGINYSSREIIVIDENKYIYNPPPLSNAREMNLWYILDYILKKKWYSKDLESKRRIPRAKVWESIVGLYDMNNRGSGIESSLQ